MHLSGQLSDWSINDLLQIMQVTKKTGSLDIEAERRGRIHFREGAVTGAELTGANGRYLGDDRSSIADVLYVLSSMEEGRFAVGAADGPDGDGWSVEGVLTDVQTLHSLELDVVDAGLFEANGLRLIESVEEPLTIEPEDWASVVALVPPFAFADLEERIGRGGAIRILHTLHRLGVAEAVAVEDGQDAEPESSKGEDESGWLDRLAEDIIPPSDEPTWVEQALDEDDDETAEDDDGSADVTVEEIGPTVSELSPAKAHADVRGVSAPASTTLTDGVYDEIRRLRSKVADA
jgi:hypothetical protein